MPTSAAPRSDSLGFAQIAGLALILILLLLAVAQCGSATEDDNPANPVETSETAPPEPEPVVQQPVPPPPAAPAPVLEPEPAPEPEPEPVYVPDYSTDDNETGAAYYKNCSAARAAGVTPLYAGEPGYGSHLDRDGDGVACE